MNESGVWKRIAKASDDECWLWKPRTFSDGYGVFRHDDGRWWLVHRFVWTVTHGPIPQGICVLHQCDVRLCANPKHLFLGTNADNVRDKRAKGRDRDFLPGHTLNAGQCNPRSKVSDADVERIREAHTCGADLEDLRGLYGLSRRWAARIVAGTARVAA